PDLRTSLPTPRSSSPCRNPARSPTTAAEAAGPLGSLGTPRRNRGGVPRPRWRSLGAGHSASKPRWSAETTVEVTGRRALRAETTMACRDHGARTVVSALHRCLGARCSAQLARGGDGYLLRRR